MSKPNKPISTFQRLLLPGSQRRIFGIPSSKPKSPKRIFVTRILQISFSGSSSVLALALATGEIWGGSAAQKAFLLLSDIFCIVLCYRAGGDVEDAGVAFAVVDFVDGVDSCGKHVSGKFQIIRPRQISPSLCHAT